MIRIGLFFRHIRTFCSAPTIEMKYLNVAEKNDAAKNIAGFLSNGSARRREGYSVYNKIYEFETMFRGQNAKMVMTSVSGHLMNFEFASSYRGWKTCNPEQLFDAPLLKSCLRDNEPIKKTLEREVKSCQGLIIWTDCDREGENIGFEIIDVCKAIRPNIALYRAKFSEITAVAARRALANLVQPDKRQSEAVDIRQELDLRTGAAFTRFQTLRLQRVFPEQIAEKLISYGSCQFPTLGFVAARYKEAEEFVSEPFWKLKVTHTIGDLTVDFNWERNRLFDKEACEDYLLLCLENPIANVVSVVTKPKNKWRPVPLDTVELEKLGSRKLKINAKTVLGIAEKLYQQGFISYPRTETNKFSKEINLGSLVENHTSHPDWGPFAQRVMEWGPNPRNGNKSDEAHPPIHPIKLTTGLGGDEKRVYELIVRHFLACVSKDATGSETIVNITIAGEKFHANGLCIYERNYLDVYPYEKWNAKQIHKYEEGQTFEPTELSMQEGATTAPPLLTEADLIALMDKHGIGTDATHAEHINTIKERGYIGEIDRGFLVPGTIGMGLYEGYHAIELPLAEPVLRAQFEEDLKRICSGERNPRDVINEQIVKYKEAYRVLSEKVRSLDEQLAKRLNEVPRENVVETTPIARVEEVLPCPKCTDSSLLLRQKKDNTSFYLSCGRFPDCKNAVWLSDQIKSAKITSETCNKCGPNYRLIEFKFKQMNYLAMLNASGLSYSTCIACDSNFRDIFQINIESVKRVGPIVSDRNNQNSNSRPTSGATNTNRNTNSRGNTTGGGPLNKKSSQNQRTVPHTRPASTTASSADSSRYRGWGSLDPNLAPKENTTNSNRNMQTEASSASALDDNLDDIFMNDDWDFGVSSTNDRENQTSNNTNNRETVSWGSFGSSVDIDSRNSAARNNGRATNENRSNHNSREQISWGSSGGTVNMNETNTTAGGVSAWNNSRNHQSPPSDQPQVKCSSCNLPAKSLIVRKDGPNKGRSFFGCSGSCSFFQWADEVNVARPTVQNTNRDTSRWSHIQPDQPDNSNRVLCSCNRPASERTVRKDGPNKGRQFYACSKENTSCDFFKWSEENSQQSAPGWGTTSTNATSSWGSGGSNSSNRSQPSTSSWGTGGSGNPSKSTTSDNQQSKKRKCGLCRQEGHTKLKCPRKAEFGDY